MICPKCKNELNNGEDFCPNCGTKLPSKIEPNINKTNSSEQDNNTLFGMVSKKSQSSNETIIQKLKNFVAKYKKQSLIGVGIIVVLTIGLILFNNLFGFDKLSWNEEYTDYKLKYVSQTNIKLGINFPNEKKEKDIKYDVTCGEVKNKGLEINWNLKKATVANDYYPASGKLIRITPSIEYDLAYYK